MRLLSLKLKNYRVHQQLSITFDPSITLIGGPNESGKSTLTEAIHRALFLKSSGRTELHSAMKSFSSHGAPEIELTFEANGRQHHLSKRYLSGTNSSTTLTGQGMAPLKGDEAEEALAKLLRTETGLGKKGVASQWAHLWTWQGAAGDDPSVHTASMKEDLLARLQSQGAGAVMQSAVDQKVAAHFRSLVDEAFNKNKKPKAGSDLAKAQEVFELASERKRLAKEQVDRLESAVEKLFNATRDLATTEAALEGLEKDRDLLTKRTDELNRLGLQEVEHRHLEKEAADKLSHCQGSDLEIRKLERDIGTLERTLAPEQGELERMKADLKTAEDFAHRTAMDYENAMEALRNLRLKKDLADAYEQRFSAAEKLAAIALRKQKLDQNKDDQSAFAERLHFLPAINKKHLRQLQTLTNQLSEATATLRGMGVELRILEGENISASGVPLKRGETCHLTEVSELCVGSGVRVEISPGGASRLREARASEADLRAELQRMLDQLGVTSSEHAGDVLLEREALEGEIKRIKESSNHLNPDAIEADFADASKEIAEASSSVSRLAQHGQNLPEPSTKQEAIALKRTLANELESEEGQTNLKRKSRDDASKELKSKGTECDTRRQTLQDKQDQLKGMRTRLQALIKISGEAETRAGALISLERAHSLAAQNLQQTQAEIASLQPDLLGNDRSRLDRSLAACRDSRENLRLEQNTAQNILGQYGTEDPRAALSVAEADAEQAKSVFESIRNRYDAYSLLDTLFTEERQRLTDLFTRPLEDKVSGYLQCIFGPASAIRLRLSDDTFAPPELSRANLGGSALEFESLSAGTREQTAAAVRLAVAEVLAADHDGCLPVVFDDAFANSDPVRVQKLQRMLDLAASRGLQVIVLSCTPNDYIGLGAKTVTLAPPAPVISMVDAPSLEQASTGPTGTQPDGSEDSLMEVFTTTLGQLGGNSSNSKLREVLGWDEHTYGAIREKLLEAGVVQTGRGRGGTVALARAEDAE